MDKSDTPENKPFGIKAFEVLNAIGIFWTILLLTAALTDIPKAIFLLLIIIVGAIALYGSRKAKSWTPYFYLTAGIAFVIIDLVIIPSLFGSTTSDLSASTIIIAIITSLFWPVILLFYRDSYFTKQ